MPRRTTLQHSLVAALATSALVASPALAEQTDRVNRYSSPTSSLAGTVSPQQDLRGEHARDAARAAEPQVEPRQPTRPIHPVSAAKPVIETGNDDDIWLVLGIGLAATGVVAGSAAGAARHYRVRARRVAP